jgi:hypothetical protein
MTEPFLTYLSYGSHKSYPFAAPTGLCVCETPRTPPDDPLPLALQQQPSRILDAFLHSD